jgi:hypothetical protein
MLLRRRVSCIANGEQWASYRRLALYLGTLSSPDVKPQTTCVGDDDFKMSMLFRLFQLASKTKCRGYPVSFASSSRDR